MRRPRRASTRHPFSHNSSSPSAPALVPLHSLRSLAYPPHTVFHAMETIDIARLKSGEVNLGVSVLLDQLLEGVH